MVDSSGTTDGAVTVFAVGSLLTAVSYDLTTMVIGPAIQCIVKTDTGQEVLVRLQRSGSNGEAEALREGDRVLVTWPEDAALIETAGEA